MIASTFTSVARQAVLRSCWVIKYGADFSVMQLIE